MLLDQVITLSPSMLGFAVKPLQEVFPGCPDSVVLIKAQLLFLALGPGLKLHVICKNAFHLLLCYHRNIEFFWLKEIFEVIESQLLTQQC